MNMKYVSPKGKEIIFDDYTDNRTEYNSWWVEMCPRCYNKYKNILGNRVSKGAGGTCSVKGCENESDYYVDFSTNEFKYADN